MPTSTAISSPGKPVDLFELIQRRWRQILIFTVLGAILGAGLYLSMGRMYQSSASVYVTATGAEDMTELVGSRTSSTVNLDTEARLVLSSAMIDRVDEELGGALPRGAIRSNVSVAVTPNTQIMEISFTAGSPTLAQEGARAFAQAYLQLRESYAQGRLDDLKDAVLERRNLLTRGLEESTKRLATLENGTPERALAAAQQSLLVDQLAMVERQLGQLEVSVVTPGRILNEASFNPTTRTQDPLFYILSAAATGFLLGLVVAALRSRPPRMLRSIDDVERTLSDSLLAVLPAAIPEGMTREELRRQVFTRSATALPEPSGKQGVSVLIAPMTSTTAGDQVADDLAVALQERGNAVSLVRAHTGVSPDLTTVDEDDLMMALTAEPQRPLREQPGGPLGGTPELREFGLVGSIGRGTRRLLRNGDWRGDYLIIVTRPTATSADSQYIAAATDANIVVLQLPLPNSRLLLESLATLRQVTTAPIGVVVEEAIPNDTAVTHAQESSNLQAREGDADLTPQDGHLEGATESHPAENRTR